MLQKPPLVAAIIVVENNKPHQIPEPVIAALKFAPANAAERSVTVADGTFQIIAVFPASGYPAGRKQA
jgi:hypothetical protein